MYMANVGVCTTDDFTECVGALVYYIDPEDEGCKIAYSNLLLGRNAIDSRGTTCSGLALAIGVNQAVGDVEAARSTTSTSRRGSRAVRWPVLRHHGHGGCERLHHHWLHEACGCAGILCRPGERGVQDRLPRPALRALVCVRHPEQLCLQAPLMAIIGAFLPGRPQLLAPLMTLDGPVLQHHGHSEPPGLRHSEHGPTKPLLFRSTGLTQLTLGLGRGNGLVSGEGGL